MMPPNTSPVNFRVGRFRLPPTFKLWPDMSQAADLGVSVQTQLPEAPKVWPDAFPALLAPAFPETPPIPPTVAAGDLITAVHENTVTEGISDLWVDLQWLASHSVTNPTTSKGDLIVNDGSALARVPVGADLQVLTADSTLPLGVRWATPTASGSFVPTSRQVIAGAGMTGGGALSADVTLNASVTTVFGRTGAIVAQSGDYTAAMVTNAVRTDTTYADPAWITSLSWGKITSTPATFPPAAHTHDASAIVSGVIATARLGTGAADASVFLRGDGTWATPSGGSGGGSQTPWTSDIDAAAHTLFSAGSINVGVGPSPSLGRVVVACGNLPGTAGATIPAINAYVFSPNHDQFFVESVRLTADTTSWTTAFWRLGRRVDTSLSSTLEFGSYSVGITTMGNRRMTVVQTGEVGIGTALPTSLLDIFTPNVTAHLNVLTISTGNTTVVSAEQRIRFLSGSIYQLGYLGVGFDPATAASGYMAFGLGGNGTQSERMRIATNGSVGIGMIPPTTAPATLEVRAIGAIGARLTAVSANNVQLRFAGAATPGDLWAIGSDIVAGNGGQDLTFYGFSPAGPKMVLLQNGNIGIGSTNPLNKFVVSNGGAGGLEINPSFTQGSFAGVYLTSYDRSASAYRDFMFDANGGSRSIVFKVSGNVGIGYTNPVAALHVAADDYRQLYLTGSVGTDKQMRLGYDLSNNTCAIDSLLNGAGVPLLLNATGGVVSIGSAIPQATALGITPQANANSVATAKIFTIGEQTNTAGYYTAFGMFHDGVDWIHSIQATSGGGGGVLMLNGLGGGVRVGSAARPSYALDVAGDINCTGVHRVNGTPIGAGPTTQRVVTGSRVSGTSYLNDTGKAMFVTTVANVSAGTSPTAYTDAANPPTTAVASGFSSAGTMGVMLSFVVLPGNWYRVNTSASFVSWVEWF